MTITHKDQLTALAISLEDQEAPKTRRKNPNWPSLLERMQWATERTVAMGLTGSESAILKHVCFVDGLGEGFFQGQPTIMKETGWSHATISRALASLTTKGLLEGKRRMGRTTKYTLLGLATMPSEPTSHERRRGISTRLTISYLTREIYSYLTRLTTPNHRTERQQNPEGNPEELTTNLLSELSESEEFKNLSETGDQDDDDDQDRDDQRKQPALAPKLFRNPMDYAKFVAAFQNGSLTRDFAHELKEHGGGVTLQEIWAYETWFADTHWITKAADYEQTIKDNIRRLAEEPGPAAAEVA